MKFLIGQKIKIEEKQWRNQWKVLQLIHNS